MDEDFSWSEPPARSRRRPVETPSRRRTAVVEREPVDQLEPVHRRGSGERSDDRDRGEQAARERAAETLSEFDALMQRWNEAYGDGVRSTETPTRSTAPTRSPEAPTRSAGASTRGTVADAYEADARAVDHYDYADLARYTDAPVVEDPSGAYIDDSGRRTVVITGRGAERYSPSSRRRQASELRFHERSGFSPDRTAMWAVLLGLALLLGCVVH